MPVYKRVNCPKCRKTTELRGTKDKLKKLTCSGCAFPFDITAENSIYWIDFFYKGERVRESIGIVTKSFAETVLYKRRLEVAENKYLDVRKEQKVRFNAFSDEYINVYAKANNPTWRQSLLPNLKSLRRFFGDKYLTEITPHLIEKYKVERMQEVSPAATNRALTLLKSMFNRAIEWNKFDDSNPVSKVKFPREAYPPENCTI